MKVLVTGAAGFVGPHLLRELAAQKITAIGTDRNPSESVRQLDVLDSSGVARLVREIRPDWIIHLAGQSSVPNSFESPELTFRINVEGTKNLFEACTAADIRPKMLIVSSAHVYGTPKYTPIDELHPLSPESPYAESRVKQEQFALEYGQENNIPVVISRSFNHTGPGQGPGFACPAFAKQIAELEAKRGGIMQVGNMGSYRDFSDVRDIAKAYILALEKCIPGQVYNIGSGKATKIKDVLDTLLSFSSAKISIRKDSSRLRKQDEPLLVCDASKFRKAAGWQPEIPLNQTLKDLLDWYRKNVRA